MFACVRACMCVCVFPCVCVCVCVCIWLCVRVRMYHPRNRKENNTKEEFFKNKKTTLLSLPLLYLWFSAHAQEAPHRDNDA